MKRVTISVINDLSTDQRLSRLKNTLLKQGWDVTLLGRQLANSLPLKIDDAEVHRFRMLFTKGPLFYAFYNLRLFFFLLFMKKQELLIAIDLDTLPANFIISRLRKLPLIYDAHEYFTEVPELLGRRRVKKIWGRMEQFILPKIEHAMTVSDSIADAYAGLYKRKFVTVRNVPERKEAILDVDFAKNYPGKYRIIYQGALNVGRGVELMIRMMPKLDDVMLILAGDGDIRAQLEADVKDLKLSDRVFFLGRITPERLRGLTPQCALGLSLEEDMGLSYRYSLPNKLFDYLHAGIPVLCSDLPEMSALVQKYGIGEVCRSRNSLELSAQILAMLTNEKKRKEWTKNALRAAETLCWEKEEIVFLELLDLALEHSTK